MKTTLRLAVVAAVLTIAAAAQMLDPGIDRPNEPFSYFSRPTDVIGVMDARSGTEITPEGYLYTGSGELMFFVGNPPRPVNVRVKTLNEGHLPVVQYSFSRDNVLYRVDVFAANLDGTPESPLVNFINFRAQPGDVKKPTTVWLSVGVRYTSQTNVGNATGDNRFRRPVLSTKPGAYYQAGVDFNPDWIYGFSGDAFLRDGKVMYVFPQTPKPEERLTLKSPGNYPVDLKPRKLRIWPDTPVGIVTYKLTFQPGEIEKNLHFVMPYEPVAADDPLVSQMRNADFMDYYARTVKFWNDMLARGIDIEVPETKVNDTFKANLIYDLIARDKVGNDYVQTVNKFHYHAFWLRDASYIIRMYDVSGYPDIARQCLDFFARWQQPDGNFVSQGGQFDGWGQAMWAYGEHYRITHDRAFAEQVYPAVQKAVAWLVQARASDPMHLMPATTPGDNEDITGHVTGHNFWALAGLKNTIALAEALNRTADAKAWRREYDDYLVAFRAALAKATASTNGYIPPGLEGQHGQDWGNMMSLYPEVILDPHDPMVAATLAATRAKYQEGIMTYGDGAFLHHYLTMKNTETELVLGDQQHAIEELYALLVHTSSTHAGFEYDIHPWGDRDFDGNLAPHGWFSAKFRTLLRDMMVREQGNDLHLLSAISPDWVKDGAVIRVERAPTTFGTVNFVLTFTAAGAMLSLDPHFTAPPARTLLHLPWFMNTASVTVDGRTAAVEDGVVALPASARQVAISWTRATGTPDLSYAAAVDTYKHEYARRYEEWLAGKE
jgi:hypothetical protein